jgi:hypothetical protein
MRPRIQCVPGESNALANKLANFTLAQRLADGLPAYYLQLWSGKLQAAGPAARILLTIAALLESEPFVERGISQAAQTMLDLFVRGGVPGSPRPELEWDQGADAQLLATLGLAKWEDEHTAVVDLLITRLRALVRADGAVYRQGPRRIEGDLDILAGIVLLGLARVRRRRPEAQVGFDLEQVMAFYSRRFSLLHPWSMVWWHSQAWAALATDVSGAGEFAFELIDWALDCQSETSGAFLIDSLPPYRSSFLSSCVLEGVAATWELALDRGDTRRADRYEQAWEQGMRFIERLVIDQEDAFFSPSPRLAAGGVRATLASSDVRIDFVGHALLALVKGLHARDRAIRIIASPLASQSQAR